MLYTEAYVLVLFKGSSHTDRIWFLWFIHKLSSWSVLLLRSAQLPPLTTEQIQHRFSAPTSVVCKSPICNWFIEEQLQVLRRSKQLTFILQTEHDQLQKHLHIFSKHLCFHKQHSKSPDSGQEQEGKNPTFFCVTVLCYYFFSFPLTHQALLMWYITAPIPQDSSHILCFYKEQQKKI